MLSVIIPANNEEGYISNCLDALVNSKPLQADDDSRQPADDAQVEVIVVTNACTDRTADIARQYISIAKGRGWDFHVFDIENGGKINALNIGDRHARGDVKVYLDADVIVGSSLLKQLAQALDRSGPAYASGRLVVSRAASWITRAYSRFWCLLPFVTEDVPGCGVYAVNVAGRSRWQEFPEIISDDTFVRLNFLPSERFGVQADYEWPMVEGFWKLVRVRKRQDIGVDEIRTRFPELIRNEEKSKLGVASVVKLAGSEFVGFCVYAAVTAAVRLSRLGGDNGWARGR